MLTRAFYITPIWMVLALLTLLLLGTRVRRSGFITSLLYFALLIGAGYWVAVWIFGELDVFGVESIIVFFAGIPLILKLRDWNAPGQSFFIFAIATTVVYLLYSFAITAFSPVSFLAFAFSFFLFLLESAALGLSLTYTFEVLDVLCRVHWRHRANPMVLGNYVPMVSLHVPVYNEPPGLVEQTLRALAKLNYPRYEVILMDNNTPSEEKWRPLASVCRQLGFKCFHLDHWPGYKSGALNFALAMTDPEAEIVGVVDADYLVKPDWLRRVVPYFADPKIAFVQTPQDYYDYRVNRFSQAAYDGYKYFFALSMLSRNERNAIIFCGTMGLLRKQVLQEIGGWDEWCITEDAEASLRMLNRGYKSLYVAESFGRGMMPLNFEGLKKQRFRWAFGGVQILKKHWSKLMPWARWIDPQNQLTGAQRYFYLFAGLQWFNEVLVFSFTALLLAGSVLTIAGYSSFLRPTTGAFIILSIILIETHFLRALWGLRNALNLSWKRSLYALTHWFSLSWVVALACIQAIVQRRGVFLRTPKTESNVAWLRALRVTSWEIVLGAACIAAGIGAIVQAPWGLTVGLLLLCVFQGLIYLSTPLHSLLSTQTPPRRSTGGPNRKNFDFISSHPSGNGKEKGTHIGSAALGILVVALAVILWPGPTKSPWWLALPAQVQVHLHFLEQLRPIQQAIGNIFQAPASIAPLIHTPTPQAPSPAATPSAKGALPGAPSPTPATTSPTSVHPGAPTPISPSSVPSPPAPLPSPVPGILPSPPPIVPTLPPPPPIVPTLPPPPPIIPTLPAPLPTPLVH